MVRQTLPPKTDLDKLNELIDWYARYKPEAGQRIPVMKGPKGLKKMLGLPQAIDAAKEYQYRGRTIVAVGVDRERY